MNSRVLLSLAWLSATLVMMIVTYSAVNLVGSSVTDQPIRAANTVEVTIADRISGGEERNSTTSTTDLRSSSNLTTQPSSPTTPSSTADGDEASGITDGPSSTTPASSSTTLGASTPPTTASTTLTTVPTTSTTEHDGEERGESVLEVTGPFPISSGGGVITVSCTDDDIKFLGATPSAGYSMQVEDSGPGRVKVRFASSENKWEIEVRCSDGAIDPRVEQDDL